MKYSEPAAEFYKRIFALALPVMAQQLLTNLVSTIDTMMIGGIGEMAISAVAIVNKVFFVYQLVIFGLSNGISIFISQYAGANQKEKITDLFNYGLRLCTFIALSVSGILVLAADPILSLFVENPAVLEESRQYLNIILFTLLPFAVTSMLSVSCRILRCPGLALSASFLSCVVNVGLNAVLIYGLFNFEAMGIKGAAVATLAARLAEMIFLYYSASRKLKEIRLKIRLALDRTMKLQIIRKALPLMGNEGIWSVGLNLVFINYSAIAESLIPAITVADNIRNLVSVAYNGFSVAAGVMIGYSLGANRLEEAKENSARLIRFSFLLFGAGAILLLIIHKAAPGWFSLSQSSQGYASAMILILAALSWTVGYSNTIYYILRAGGDMKSVLIIDGLFTWFGPVLFSFLAAHVFHLSLLNAFCLVEGTGLIKVVLATVFYRRGGWIKNLTILKKE